MLQCKKTHRFQFEGTRDQPESKDVKFDLKTSENGGNIYCMIYNVECGHGFTSSDPSFQNEKLRNNDNDHGDNSYV